MLIFVNNVGQLNFISVVLKRGRDCNINLAAIKVLFYSKILFGSSCILNEKY